MTTTRREFIKLGAAATLSPYLPTTPNEAPPRMALVHGLLRHRALLVSQTDLLRFMKIISNLNTNYLIYTVGYSCDCVRCLEETLENLNAKMKFPIVTVRMFDIYDVKDQRYLKNHAVFINGLATRKNGDNPNPTSKWFDHE